MAGFFDFDARDIDYDNLPPLVPKGADREAILEKIVAGWCTATGFDPEFFLRAHVARGGCCLEGANLWDANNDEPIDLGDLLMRVAERLREEGAPSASRERPDLHILMRACRADICQAHELFVRPRFWTVGVRFGNRTTFARTVLPERTSFREASFGSCVSFSRTRFGAGASFWHTTFGDAADFVAARFGRSAKLDDASFGEGASFCYATFEEHVSFEGARFSRAARFCKARLPKADFRGASLADADLEEAHLEQADVRGVQGLLFDDNYVRDLRIEGNAPDPWSVLRRTYSGPRYFLHLLLLIAFFTPYVAKALYYTYASHLQEQAITTFGKLQMQIEQTPLLHGDGLPWPDLAALTVEMEQSFYQQHVYTPTVWQFLTGGHGLFGLTLAAVAVLYNALRLALTLQVSHLREAEERSHTTPRLVDYYGQCHPRGRNKLGRTVWAALRLWWGDHRGTTRGRAPVRFRAWPDWLSGCPRWLKWSLVAVGAVAAGGVRALWRARVRRCWYLRVRRFVWTRKIPVQGQPGRLITRWVNRIDKYERPYSFLECVGLYRVHLFASLLLYVTIAATGWNLLNWAASTWIWVPIGQGV